MFVLVHGLGVGPRYLERLSTELHQDEVVLAPDLRHPLPVRLLAARLAAAMPSPAIVVANSMGCQVATELAMQRPDLVEALALIGPTVEPDAHGLLRHVGRLAVDAWYEPPSLLALVAREYVRFGPIRLLRHARLVHADRIEERLPRLGCPVVVIRGARDPLCPARWARAAAALPRFGSLVTIAGAAHAAHYSHPREVAGVVRRLRAGVPAAAR